MTAPQADGEQQRLGKDCRPPQDGLEGPRGGGIQG